MLLGAHGGAKAVQAGMSDAMWAQSNAYQRVLVYAFVSCDRLYHGMSVLCQTFMAKW